MNRSTMSIQTLQQECYRQGFATKLAALIRAPQTVKSALHPLAAGRVLVDPRRAKSLAALGEEIYTGATKSHDVIPSLWASLLPSYNQVNNMNRLRQTHFDTLARFKPMIARASPEERARLVNELRTLTRGYQGEKRQLFSEIGAVVEPRQRMMRRTGVAAGVGGAAYGGGLVGQQLGQRQGQKQERQQAAGRPLMHRLSYLFAPERTMNPPAPKAAPRFGMNF
jgi:hypothetical protein